MKQLVVRNIDPSNVPCEEALLIYSLGFETRSRFIANTLAVKRQNVLAVSYREGRILSFQENDKFCSDRGFSTVEDAPEKIRKAIQEKIAQLRSDKRRIVIDVSAMNRAVMAEVLVTVLDELRTSDDLCVFYTPAKFRQPSDNLLPIRHIGPVHPVLSGTLAAPHMRRALLLGLGYEYGVSLSILDTHEPDMAFIFKPHGFDTRFDKAVDSANFSYDFGEREYEVIDYWLENSASVYGIINNVVASSKHNTSIVCVPLGPKLISSIMIVAAYVHAPEVAVLRYSLASLGSLVDVEADGRIVGYSVSLLTGSN